MIDAEDRETLLILMVRYGFKFMALVIGIIGLAVTLGAAVRIFEVLAGW